MTEPMILPVTPGSLSSADKKALSDAGVIVMEHAAPSELRLIRATSEVSAGAMLACAMEALAFKDTSLSSSTGSSQREKFVFALNAAIQAKAKS